MTCKRPSLFRGVATALVFVSAMAGCGGAGNARFTPDADVARASLETALGAWRDGKPYGPIESTPPINVADSAWQSGKQIESFQIGDEVTEKDGVKEFSVKLTLKKDRKVEDVHYLVNGRDLIWIFSEADYKKMINMESGPEPAKKAGTAARRRPR
jgi:hypothetical protein